MCGIAVHFRPSGVSQRFDLTKIRHRGPDACGEWISPNGNCWLGSTRLAILDLSPAGAQPMTDASTGNTIVANGEIYNHRELRTQLGPGVNWQGTGDTETLLHAYNRWGVGMLDKLKGMFAFAIYDQKRNALFVARDRFGIKPLYYVADAGGIRAASEIKMFDPNPETITPQSVSDYLQWGASPESSLIYPTIKSFPAGHAMILGSDAERKFWRYWPSQPAFVSSASSAPEKVRRLIEAAVEEHLLSDVPVASFLSGGIDSSIVTAIAAQQLGKNLQTFSVGFDVAEFDETSIAAEVAKRYGTDHHRIELRDDQVIEWVGEAVENFDLPSVDAVNTYIVSKVVASHGIKVALSGLGGDELFGGYSSFRDVPNLLVLSKLPRFIQSSLALLGHVGARLADLPSAADASTLAWWRRKFFPDALVRRAGLPVAPISADRSVALPDDYARISWAELTGYMRHLLLRDADQMSMAVSLELRVPFLDHDLVEYVVGLPKSAKKINRQPKGLLIEACRDLLPSTVYDRPKRGFTLPMRKWMLGPLASFVAEGLDVVTASELLPQTFVSELKQGFEADRLHWTRLWSVVVLGHFVRRADKSNRSNENIAVHSFA